MTKRKSNPLICNSIFRLSCYSAVIAFVFFPKGNSLNKCVIGYNSTHLSRKTTPLVPLPPRLPCYKWASFRVTSNLQACANYTWMTVSCNHYTPLTNPFRKGHDCIPRHSIATAALVCLELYRAPSRLLSGCVQLEPNRDMCDQKLVLLTHCK